MKYLEELEAVLYRRKQELPARSYTANLFRDGEDRILKKIIEATGEVMVSTKNNDPEELMSSLGDLIFHLQILLVQKNLSLKDVVQVLEKRHR